MPAFMTLAPAAQDLRPITPQRLHLLPGRACMTQSSPHDLVITIMAGTVWVTVDGDARDHLLVSGESLALPARKQAVLQALKGAASILIATSDVF